MDNLQTLLEWPVVESIGWALVHSVWQIALVAALYAIGRLALRNRSALLRYGLACAALGMMIVAVTVTTCIVWSTQPQPSAVGVTPVALTSDPAPEVLADNGEKTPPEFVLVEPVERPIDTDLVSERTGLATLPVVPIEQSNRHEETASNAAASLAVQDESLGPQLVEIINDWLPWLVAAWLLGVVAFSTRLACGWLGVHRLCRRGTSPVADSLQEKLNRLCHRLGVHRAVRLAQSTLVEVPAVAGHLRPVILMPVSFVTGLSPSQVEVLLLHELAHIRRHDYLVNLIQTAIETLLFYHPAVWWLSRQIRQERENCCDDLVLSVCNDPTGYAQALASMEELRTKTCHPALAVSGGSLLTRIRRIVGKRTEGPTRRHAWLAGVMLLGMVLTTMIGVTGATSGTIQNNDEVESQEENKKTDSNETEGKTTDPKAIKDMTAKELGESLGKATGYRFEEIAFALSKVGTPESIRPLTKALFRIGRGEFDKNHQYRSAIPAVIDAIRKIEKRHKMKQPYLPATLGSVTSWSLGGRLRYPYEGSSPVVWSLDRLDWHRVEKPRKADPDTDAGRKAIYQSLVDASPKESFTMDGDRLLVWGGLRVAPWKPSDLPNYRGAHETMKQIYQMRLAKRLFAKKAADLGEKPGPLPGMVTYPLSEKVSRFVARTKDGRTAVFWVERTTKDFQYSDTAYYLDPLYELVLYPDTASDKTKPRPNTASTVEAPLSFPKDDPRRDLQFTLTADKEEYFLGENIVLHYEIENRGKKPFYISMGGDGRNSARRALRFKVEMVDEQGHKAYDPHPTPDDFGGMGGQIELKPGDTFCEDVPLMRYREPARAGTYTIRVYHDLEWDRALPEQLWPRSMGSDIPSSPHLAPVLTTTLRLRMPDARQARQVIDKTLKLSTDPNRTWGKRGPPYADYELIRYPVYLPMMRELAEKGDVHGLEAIGAMPFPEATEALLDLAEQKKRAIASKAQDLLFARTPPLTPAPFSSKRQHVLATRSWNPELKARAVQLAWRLLANKNYDGQIRGGQILRALGDKDDLPKLIEVMDRLLPAYKDDEVEQGAWLRPAVVSDSLDSATTALIERGATPPTTADTPGSAVAFLAGLDKNPKLRPKGWEKTTTSLLKHELPFLRTQALQKMSVPLDDEAAVLVGDLIKSKYAAVQSPACVLAGKSKLARFRQPLMEVLRTTTNDWVLRDAFSAADACGVKKDRILETLVNRLEHRSNDRNMVILGLMIDESISHKGGSGARSHADWQSFLGKLQAAWRKFIEANRPALQKGKLIELGDPTVTPDMVPPGYYLYLRGRPWPSAVLAEGEIDFTHEDRLNRDLSAREGKPVLRLDYLTFKTKYGRLTGNVHVSYLSSPAETWWVELALVDADGNVVSKDRCRVVCDGTYNKDQPTRFGSGMFFEFGLDKEMRSRAKRYQIRFLDPEKTKPKPTSEPGAPSLEEVIAALAKRKAKYGETAFQIKYDRTYKYLDDKKPQKVNSTVLTEGGRYDENKYIREANFRAMLRPHTWGFDDREIEYWREAAVAGNLYIKRRKAGDIPCVIVGSPGGGETALAPQYDWAPVRYLHLGNITASDFKKHGDFWMPSKIELIHHGHGHQLNDPVPLFYTDRDTLKILDVKTGKLTKPPQDDADQADPKTKAGKESLDIEAPGMDPYRDTVIPEKNDLIPNAEISGEVDRVSDRF